VSGNFQWPGRNFGWAFFYDRLSKKNDGSCLENYQIICMFATHNFNFNNMKVTQISEKDRNLFGITVRQKAENEFLNLTDLEKACELKRMKHGWSFKRMDNLFISPDFLERAFFLIEEGNILIGIDNQQPIKSLNPVINGATDNQHFMIGGTTGNQAKERLNLFLSECEENGTRTVFKKLGIMKATGRGSNRETYTHPYLWVLIAMELNPILYAKVITWLTDGLIFNRIEAGKMYRSLTDQLKEKFGNPNYPTIAIRINEKIFGKHQTDIRNTSCKNDLERLTKLQSTLETLLKSNFFQTEQELLGFIDKCTV
jgi:hypothetical protein